MDKKTSVKSSKPVVAMDDDKSKLISVEPQDSPQLDLFYITGDKFGVSQYSNFIEDIDALPKFVWGKSKVVHDLQDVVRERTYKAANREVIVRTTAAIITRVDSQGNKKNVAIFPGEREEFVDDALKKLAVSGGAKFLKDQSGVVFTLHKLQEELKATGHTYAKNEIKEALFVLRNSIYECITERETIISASFISLLSLTSADDFKSDRESKCLVQFNPIVHKSITSLDFKPYNYSVSMSIRSPLARFIYKRMCMFWTQASMAHPYTPNLLSFLKSTPRGLTSGMQGNKRAMESALEELKKREVLDSWVSNPIYANVSSGKKPKVLDHQYRIYPHPKMVKDVLHANSAKKKLTKIKKERSKKN